MTLAHSLQRAAANATAANQLLRNTPKTDGKPSAQLRRYEVCTLLPNGSVTETRHIAPALPLFEQAFTAFSRGSLVETDFGPVAIEDLLPGDQIQTADGHFEEVVWKGMTTLIPARSSATGASMKLTSFMADSFGMQKPSSCVVAGPAARLLATPPHLRHSAQSGEILTPVQDFQDGINIFETAPPAPVDMFHICLRNHAVIKVGGLLFESYHPGTDALRLVSYPIKTLFLNMFPHVESIADFGPLAFERALTTQA
ncbi:hypothetical protein TRM7557_00791 [Tritonibacter multivorans]|uniref:Hedgehog/Intein (Hint) domain-containing protein n=1 Tax=Tritonibacter multivorans TaxID=928856 RepID=A0A0P1G3M0_9RHOB|nr:Hint domain-containing protein [Tritonibacter multivorans]MDA7422838.1 Hint domain-containing protein [Tritonibacter multivorans]CUH76253.1 hypothetical protein TRM7557_00791 [Tritonibacter multivorans]SFD61584.1 Hint domain-containing protein [Tritonibacter multivorans]